MTRSSIVRDVDVASRTVGYWLENSPSSQKETGSRADEICLVALVRLVHVIDYYTPTPLPDQTSIHEECSVLFTFSKDMKLGSILSDRI